MQNHHFHFLWPVQFTSYNFIKWWYHLFQDELSSVASSTTPSPHLETDTEDIKPASAYLKPPVTNTVDLQTDLKPFPSDDDSDDSDNSDSDSGSDSEESGSGQQEVCFVV